MNPSTDMARLAITRVIGAPSAFVTGRRGDRAGWQGSSGVLEVPMSSSARWTIVMVLLVPAVVLPLLVGVYARTDPELWGFPFYYWFQFLLIPVAAALTTTAYWLTKGDERPADEPGRDDDPAEAVR